MSSRQPSLPAGYDVTKFVPADRSDCLIAVGFDQDRAHIPRFLIQLHYNTGADAVGWQLIARMDHNETTMRGHNVYQEGLHIDVDRHRDQSVKLHPSHAPLPQNRGVVIRRCVDYFIEHADYFVDVFRGNRPPGGPPQWSDGGEPTPTFNRVDPVEASMSRESAPENTEAIESDDLTALLADATDTTPADLERQAEELEIAPPEDATILDENRD